MTGPPLNPYQPYEEVHASPQRPDDARTTASQIIKDCNLEGKLGGKTILTTGASASIGETTARALQTTGAKLLLAARDIGGMERIIEDMGKANPNMAAPEAIELRLDLCLAFEKQQNRSRPKLKPSTS